MMHFEMNQLARMTSHTNESPIFIPHKASVSLNLASVSVISVLITTIEL